MTQSKKHKKGDAGAGTSIGGGLALNRAANKKLKALKRKRAALKRSGLGAASGAAAVTGVKTSSRQTIGGRELYHIDVLSTESLINHSYFVIDVWL